MELSTQLQPHGNSSGSLPCSSVTLIPYVTTNHWTRGIWSYTAGSLKDSLAPKIALWDQLTLYYNQGDLTIESCTLEGSLYSISLLFMTKSPDC